MANRQINNSPHILNAASNLLGLCFIVLTSIRFLKMQKETYVDDVTAIAFLLFMSSTLLSFLSIQNKNPAKGEVIEKLAEYVFLAGLVCIFVAAIMITTVVIK